LATPPFAVYRFELRVWSWKPE